MRQRLARTEARLASRRRTQFLGGAALATTLAAGLWAGRALSQSQSCGAVNVLPAAYKTMCPNTPAVADDVNANFKKLIERVEAGSATTDTFGAAVVTFPQSFAAPPKIVAQASAPGVVIQISSRSATGFTAVAVSVANFMT